VAGEAEVNSWLVLGEACADETVGAGPTNWHRRSEATQLEQMGRRSSH
jgi:hypothetical protein